MEWFGVLSYGLATVLYGVAGVVLLVRRAEGNATLLLLAATLVSSLSAGVIAAFLLSGGITQLLLVVLDALRLFVWTMCVLAWLAPARAKFQLLLLSLAAGVCGVWLAASASIRLNQQWAVYAMLVAMSLIGFLAVEQVFRNAKEEQRGQLILLCLAAGGVFAIDLCVYSQATLLRDLVPLFWEARGLASVALAPLIVVAVGRQSDRTGDIFVSRQFVFYTTSLLGVGGYLLVMGLVASVIRAFRGEWSFLLELVFLFAALAILGAVLFSAKIRARFKVFLIKHFYRTKYDYREEWLHLTQSLGQTGDLPLLAVNALQGLARIVGSRQGDLWLAGELNQYDWIVSIDGKPGQDLQYPKRHPIPTFLAANGWVIDSDEYARDPDLYRAAFGDPSDHVLPPKSIIVPLDCQGHLQGFVALARPPELRPLNFEDHDILKTAGRQVAVVLAQAMMQEKLAETRQFEAMNKLSTFLMHDLKNVVAQQQLVVANAQRFRHRPEFIDDAMTTIRSGVERMRKVLDQLSSSTRNELTSSRANLSKVLMEVRSQCSDRQPVPQIQQNGAGIWVGMDRERLTSVLTHLVRNAQDATAPDGRIDIEFERNAAELTITVADTGNGMDGAFIRDRLFRPFDSTKGTNGMGIGAYQVRDTVRAAGGDVEVHSKPGVGTRFCVRLPIAPGDGSARESPGRMMAGRGTCAS